MNFEMTLIFWEKMIKAVMGRFGFNIAVLFGLCEEHCGFSLHLVCILHMHGRFALNLKSLFLLLFSTQKFLFCS